MNLGRIGVQEYPMSAEEAFLTSGDCYFDVMVLKMLLESCKEPILDPQVV